MTPKDDIELRLESWLTETARPIPTAVLEDVVDVLPRQRQVGRQLGPPSRRVDTARRLLVAASLIVAVGTIAATIGPNRFVDSLAGAAPSPSSAPGSWNAATDFRSTPDQRNPSPDQAENPGVWSYLSVPVGAAGPGPATLLSTFDEEANIWTTEDGNVGVARVDGALAVWPWLSPGEGMRAVAVRWRSPVAATVRVSGLVGLGSGSCDDIAGAGVTLTIVRNGAPPELHTLDPLVSRPFSRGLTVASSFGFTAAVEPGDTIDFVISPRAMPDCLDALLYLRITAK
jgi:hypothetical protein